MKHQIMNPYCKRLEILPGYLNIMGYVDESEVNGPGCRAVIWVQGCLRECASCFNLLPKNLLFFSHYPNLIISRSSIFG